MKKKIDETIVRVMKTLLERFGEPNITGHEPDDYTSCEYCGFDHDYEPTEANKWHKAHPGQEELEEETSTERRRKIAMKSPQSDKRPRCEDCGKVLTRSDYLNYWDGNHEMELNHEQPRCCEDCAEVTGDERVEMMNSRRGR